MPPTITPPPDPSKCSYYQGFYDALALVYDALKATTSHTIDTYGTVGGPAHAYRRYFLDTIDIYRAPFDAQYRTRVNPPDTSPPIKP